MINGAPEVVDLSVDPDEDLVQVPLQLRSTAMSGRSLFLDLGCEHETEPVPPGRYGLMADVDPAFVQQIASLPQR